MRKRGLLTAPDARSGSRQYVVRHARRQADTHAARGRGLGSFGAAAKELCFTPSAVWQQMAALEREAGTQLFERGPRGARLTHSRQVLLAHAEVALGRLDRAEAELAAIAGGEGGQLRFGSFPTATESFVACAVRAFRSRHPGVDRTSATRSRTSRSSDSNGSSSTAP